MLLAPLENVRLPGPPWLKDDTTVDCSRIDCALSDLSPLVVSSAHPISSRNSSPNTGYRTSIKIRTSVLKHKHLLLSKILVYTTLKSPSIQFFQSQHIAKHPGVWVHSCVFCQPSHREQNLLHLLIPPLKEYSENIFSIMNKNFILTSRLKKCYEDNVKQIHTKKEKIIIYSV